MSITRLIPDEAAMRAFGAELAARYQTRSQEIIFLSGPLGAGKTTLVRGFLRAMGHKGPVKSPTYTLVVPYVLAGRRVYHIDLYRLQDPTELEALGMRDLLTDATTLLIEWPECAAGALPAPTLICRLDLAGDARKVCCTEGACVPRCHSREGGDDADSRG
jgi:tRNA threonylcarbamoyladenosine biosynthesis protein TsaE